MPTKIHKFWQTMAVVVREFFEPSEALSLIERHSAYSAIRCLSFYSANHDTWSNLKRLARAYQKAVDSVDLEAQNIDHVHEAEHAFHQACLDVASNKDLEAMEGLLDDRNIGLFQTLVLQWYDFM